MELSEKSFVAFFVFERQILRRTICAKIRNNASRRQRQFQDFGV